MKGAAVEIISIRTPSLGDATYVAVHGDNAVIIDPQRDIGRFTDVLEDRGLTLTHVLETHMHNDYISGGRDLAQSRGADLVLPAASGAAFAFRAAFHNEDLDATSGLTIRPLHTPGHTPEHTSYLLLIDGEEHAVFTGGSLLVGAAGRSDLLGTEYARELSRLQFGSLQRLGLLPDATGVFPTHGEGSFCTASGAGRTTSTIGQEKAENPLYSFKDAEAFITDQLSSLVPYPRYYAHMGPTNKQNPTAVTITAPPELSAAEAAAQVASGTMVLDGRDRYSFASAHIAGSIGIELGDSYAPWTGWLLEYNAPLVLVLDDVADSVAAATELARIGFTDIRGVIRGIDKWAKAGQPTSSYPTATHTDLMAQLPVQSGDLQVLDVRDPLEWKAGHIKGSYHRYVPDIAEGLPGELDLSKPVWVVCQSGNRATIAAGLLEMQGAQPIVVAKGGVTDILSTLPG
jgi:glyoxylase-like metal-dependent hydrolase (beta-lactamase superfamily II)/rhodanese-related sulfurtransferase